MAWNLHNGISRAVWLSSYWTSLNPSVMGWMVSPSTPNSHDKVLTPGISVWHLFAFFFLFIFLNTIIFLINRLYFSVLGLRKNWKKKHKKFSNTPFSPPSVYPVINILHWYDTFFFSTVDEPILKWLLTKVHCLHLSSSFVLHASVYFDKYRMACLHHYSIMFNSVQSLRSPMAPTIVPLLGTSHGQKSLVCYSPWGHKSWAQFTD